MAEQQSAKHLDAGRGNAVLTDHHDQAAAGGGFERAWGQRGDRGDHEMHRLRPCLPLVGGAAATPQGNPSGHYAHARRQRETRVQVSMRPVQPRVQDAGEVATTLAVPRHQGRDQVRPLRKIVSLGPGAPKTPRVRPRGSPRGRVGPVQAEFVARPSAPSGAHGGGVAQTGQPCRGAERRGRCQQGGRGRERRERLVAVAQGATPPGGLSEQPAGG